MADFMRKYMAQKSRRESPLFRHPLNPIVEDIPVVTQPFLIQRSGAEHIGTITDLRAHCARKDLQHEVSGPYDVATCRLNILRAVSPTVSTPACRKIRCTCISAAAKSSGETRSEEHTSELQSRFELVCRLLLEKKKT